MLQYMNGARRAISGASLAQFRRHTPMMTKYGRKSKPIFKIVGWKALGNKAAELRHLPPPTPAMNSTSALSKEENMSTIKLHTINPEPADTPAGPPDDPFADLSKLRLDQSFVEAAGVKKLLTTIPVRRPNPQDFVRVRPDPEYRAPLAIIEVRDDREIYLVPPHIATELQGEFVMATLYTTVSR